MARIGKIARLPRAVRTQLNSRLHDGGEGKPILQWLNSLPEVQAVLAESFDGHPVSEQNLSDWRQGGYGEWLAYQDILAQAADLAANRQELEAAAPGQSPSDLLAAAVSFRYAAILAAQGPELDDESLTQLRVLDRVCQAVVKLRRSDQNAARLKIEKERWELERERILTGNEEETKRKLREALAAPILATMKMGETMDKLGGGPMSAMGAEMLREIESCPDPAHFESRIQSSKTEEEWGRYFKKVAEEQAKNPPSIKKTLEPALELYREMERGLGLRRAKRKAGSAEAPSKPRRRVCKPAKPQARRHKAKTRRAPVAADCDRRKNPEEDPGSAGASASQQIGGAHRAPLQGEALSPQSPPPSPPPLPAATDDPIKPNQA